MSLSADLDVGPLTRSLDEAADDLLDLTSTHQDVGTMLVTAALPVVPRLSGRLADTVRTIVTPAGPVLTAGGNGVAYGYRATPALTATIARQTTEVVDHYAAAVDQAVDKITGA